MRIAVVILFFSLNLIGQQHLCPPCLEQCSWPYNQISVVGTPSQASCTNTGGVDITVTGNTSPYSYVWSNGQVGEDLVNVNAGTYSVTVTNGFGCTAIGSYVVTQNCPCTIDATANPTSAVCGQGGSINLIPTGSPTPTYSWSNGDTTEDISNLANGTYYVTMTNQFCNVTKGPYVVGNSGSISALITTNDETCGRSNGNASVFGVTGGTGTYSYAWSNGGGSNAITNMPSGAYSVTVSSGTTCSIVLRDTIVDETRLATAVVYGGDQEICVGENLSLDATTTGTGRTILWTPSTYLSNATIDDPVFSGAPVGVYQLNIRATIGTTCSAVAFKTITVEPTITTGGTISGIQEICNGAIPSTLSSVTGPDVACDGASYFWQSKTTGDWGAAINPRNNPFYAFTASNAPTVTTQYRRLANCPCGASTTSIESNAVTVTVLPKPIQTFTVPSSICKGNEFSVTLATTTTTAPYAYKIYHNTTLIHEETNMSTSINKTFSGYTSGTFKSTVTDAKGCISSESIKSVSWIDVPSISLAKVGCTLTKTLINGNCGAFVPTYSWEYSTDGVTGWAQQSTTSNNNLVVTQDGYWRVKATCSQTGCSGYSNVVNTSACTCNCMVTASINASCQLEASTSGNCGSYTYTVYRNETPQGGGLPFSPLLSGSTYKVEAVTGGACPSFFSNVVAPDGITSTGVIDQQSSSSCDGTINPPNLTTSGWVGCDSYINRWEESVNGGAWSTVGAGSSYDPPSFTSGTKSYRLCRSCVSTCATEYCSGSVTYGTDPKPVFTINGTTPICKGSSTTLSSTLSGDYSFLWSTLETSSTINVSTTGRYYLRMTNNATSCTDEKYLDVVVKDTLLNLEQIASTAAQASCGSYDPTIINGAVQGSCGGLIYQWENKTTGGWNPISSTNSVSYDPPTISQTTTYRRKTTCDCGVPKYSNEVVKTVYPTLSVGVDYSNDVCIGDSTLATASVFGGTSPFTYSWSTGSTTNQTYLLEGYATNTWPKYYSVTVTDANGCTGVKSNIYVFYNGNIIYTPPNANKTDVSSCDVINPANVTINGYNDGGGCVAKQMEFYESINGGAFAIYKTSATPSNSVTESWPRVAMTPSTSEQTRAYKMCAYCSECPNPVLCSNVVTYTTKALPTISVSKDGDLTCADGTVQLSVTGNGVSQSWTGPNNFTDVSATPNVYNEGTYNVTTTSSQGCTASGSVVVDTDYDKPDDDVTNASICYGESYTWPVNNRPYTSPLTGVKIINSSCAADQVLNLTVNPLPTVSATGGALTCEVASVELNYTSAASFVSWQGLNYLEFGDASPLRGVAGSYTVTVQDGNDCINRANATISGDYTKPPSQGFIVNICQGDSYSWGGTSYNTSGTYLRTNGDCVADSTLELSVRELPVVNAGEDRTICQGDTPRLTAQCVSGDCTPNLTFSWVGGPNNAVYDVSPTTTTAYTVSVQNPFGCVSATDAVTVNVNTTGSVSSITNNNIASEKSDLYIQNYTINYSGGTIVSTSFGLTGDNGTLTKVNDTQFYITPTNTNSSKLYGVAVVILWSNGCFTTQDFLVTIADGREGWALYTSGSGGIKRHWMFYNTSTSQFERLETNSISGTSGEIASSPSGILYSFVDTTIYQINKSTGDADPIGTFYNSDTREGMGYQAGGFYTYNVTTNKVEAINFSGALVSSFPLYSFTTVRDIWVSGRVNIVTNSLYVKIADGSGNTGYVGTTSANGLVMVEWVSFFSNGTTSLGYSSSDASISGSINLGVGTISDLAGSLNELKKFIMP